MTLTIKEIAAEMARRKVRFHPGTNWDKIKLWGLFSWGDVSRLLKTGDLITDMKKENRTIWVWPSKDFWEKKIKPLIEKHSLDELTKLAGCDSEFELERRAKNNGKEQNELLGNQRNDVRSREAAHSSAQIRAMVRTDIRETANRNNGNDYLEETKEAEEMSFYSNGDIEIYWWNIDRKTLDFRGPIREYLKIRGITHRRTKVNGYWMYRFKINTSCSTIVLKTTEQHFNYAAEQAVLLFLTQMGDKTLYRGHTDYRMNWR